MSIKSLCLGLMIEETAISDKALSYVASLASRSAAHLTVKIGVPEFAPMGNLMLYEIGGMVVEANANRRGRADALAKKLEAMLSATGVSPDIEVVQEAYYVARDRILRACRVSDLTIVTRSDPISGLERDLTEELLFSSGRPLLLVPPNAPNQATLDVVSLAWDGGERAARAAGDAAALLPPSARIEVVCVAGDRDKTKQAAGWDICRNLARHFTAATVATVEADDGGVSAAILAQAKASGASLLVMGGYGHSRFRQVVLGGVTHDMIASAPIPVLLSY